MNVDINLFVAIRDLLLQKEYKPSEIHNLVVILNEIDRLLAEYEKAKKDENKENSEKE